MVPGTDEAAAPEEGESVWVISCVKASEQRGWISAIGAALASADASGAGSSDSAGGGAHSLVEVSLQEGMKEVAARRVQAGTRGMLVRHTPEVRLQVALRRAQLRDTELLRPADRLEISSESEEEEDPDPLPEFRYSGPDGPHIMRLRQNLRAASFGKGETHGHDQDVKTLFQRFDTDNNGLLSRADFGDMLRRGGKASMNRASTDGRRTSLLMSHDRPGHVAALELSEQEVDEIFAALDPEERRRYREPRDARGVSMEALHAFVWGIEGLGSRWAVVRGAVRSDGKR